MFIQAPFMHTTHLWQNVITFFWFLKLPLSDRSLTPTATPKHTHFTLNIPWLFSVMHNPLSAYWYCLTIWMMLHLIFPLLNARLRAIKVELELTTFVDLTYFPDFLEQYQCRLLPSMFWPILNVTAIRIHQHLPHTIFFCLHQQSLGMLLEMLSINSNLPWPHGTV